MADLYTVGVEEEYQLIDPQTGELRSRADEVLHLDWSDEIRQELQKTMVEIGTTVCEDTKAVGRELRRLRFQVGGAAAAEGLDILAAGLHPFSHWEGHQMSEGERPEMIRERFGRIGRDEHLFGMHIHVAVPDDSDRNQVMERVRPYTPHLLALSCSSPFFEGEDSGFASFRTIIWRRLPLSGAPPHFRDAAEYERFIDLLLRTGAVPDRKTLYWGVRLSPKYPTIEFRSPDVCPRIDDAVAIAALARMLIVAAVEDTLPPPHTGGFNPALLDAIIDTNRWLAARYGMDAELIDAELDRGVPVRDAVRSLVDRFGPRARELGDGDSLDALEALLRRGNSAEQMRQRVAGGSDMRGLVDWLAGETALGTGLDRRNEQRIETPV